jgi:hypothetical protein
MFPKSRGVKAHYRDYYYAADSNAADDDELAFAHNLAERQPLLLVPIPFASDWANQALVGKSTDGLSNDGVSEFRESSNKNKRAHRGSELSSTV